MKDKIINIENSEFKFISESEILPVYFKTLTKVNINSDSIPMKPVFESFPHQTKVHISKPFYKPISLLYG